ncbi:hypothetical protein, partial [Vibrio metschnikovii]|uniref:hypothetical protein n=1 Tax=Vibrio metschnikovii TaxID=28172 RepID=UPI0030B9F24A
ANKRFKRDSQRVAFLLCVGFRDYGVMRKVGSSVGCPLSGRYVVVAFGDFTSNFEIKSHFLTIAVCFFIKIRQLVLSGEIDVLKRLLFH